MQDISEEDKILWERATKDVKPLQGNCEPYFGSPKAITVQQEDTNSIMPPAGPTYIANETGNGQIDANISRQMRKGNWQYYLMLDFHGSRTNEAFYAFVQNLNSLYRYFIRNHGDNRLRNVLIVTGKSGKMRKEFPEWCKHPSIKRYIQYACPAHPKHGGDGAWYLILKKPPYKR